MVYNKEYLHYNSAYWTYLLTRIQSLISNGGHFFEDKRTYLCCIIRSTYRGVGDDTAHPTRLHPRSDHCPDTWRHVGWMFSGETDGRSQSNYFHHTSSHWAACTDRMVAAESRC